MTEEPIIAASDPVQPVEATALGAYLCSLRKEQGLSLAAVSMRLKYSQRQIAALEAEDWERLPTGMSLRGLVRNYARYLGADDAPVLARLDALTGHSARAGALTQTGGPREPASVSMDEDTPRGHWGWPFIILAVILAAVLYAIQRGWIPDTWLVFDWLKSLKK